MSIIGPAISDRGMRFELVFFDFDGTLVQSSAIKRTAFFDVFPADPTAQEIVDKILNADPDGSRHAVIPRMCDAMIAGGILDETVTPAGRVEAYSKLVIERVATCPETKGASDLLRDLAVYCPIYVISNTPHDTLETLLEARGWQRLLTGFFGYPHEKTAVIRKLISESKKNSENILVFGDGVSDERAARDNGCRFVKTDDSVDLMDLYHRLGAAHV